MVVERDVLIERSTDPFAGMRVAWGGVFGGVLLGIGVLLLLATLGLAVGISTVDPRNPDAGAIGTGTAIWAALSLLIALFVGGWASTRLSMLWDRTTAMFEGALVWVLSMVLILYLAANGVALVAGGAFGIVSSAAQGAGSAAASITDLDQLVSGNPQQILQRLNDPQLATRLASALDMPLEQVEGTLASARQRVASVQGSPQRMMTELRQATSPLLERAKERAAQTAAAAQPEATTTAWIMFAALLLSLLAAIAGAAVGRRNVEGRTAGGVTTGRGSRV